MAMPGRELSPMDYRYGFNGKEKDDEVKGHSGTSLDFGARIYDPRIGRFLSLDPKSSDFCDLSPYIYAINSPITFIDQNGENVGVYVDHKTQTIIIKANYYVSKGDNEAIARAEAAVGVWNSRESDKRGGFLYKYDKNKPAYKIAFELQVIESENVQQSVENDNIGNSFAINNAKVGQYNAEHPQTNGREAGAVTSDGKNIASRVLSSPAEESHEVGHTLGLGHFPLGIMEDYYSGFAINWQPTVGNVNYILNKAGVANPLSDPMEKGDGTSVAKIIDLGANGKPSDPNFGTGYVVPTSVETYQYTTNPNYVEPKIE